MTDTEELARLRAENARLVRLLETHGIDWRVDERGTAQELDIAPSQMSAAERIALFRRRFRGREDVYPLRWQSKSGTRSGYSPACANEWEAGICEKPRVKCGACAHRALLPLTDQVIYEHLIGKRTLGVYPLLADDTCRFLAVDFDDEHWRDDVLAFAAACDSLSVPVHLEISRSGEGAHAWIFFDQPVPASDARRLGTAIISHACARTRQLRLESYDRLFPNQDTMPAGGFGNLIALPLQKHARERGFSVFVDRHLRAFADQWAYLAEASSLSLPQIEAAILGATGGAHPLDVAFIEEEDFAEPWRRPTEKAARLPGPMPKALAVTLANQVYFEKRELPQPLANRLVRLAAFQNPAFYRAQAMRMSVWDKPRVIGCAQNYPRHIALPRGCLDAARALLKRHDVRLELIDERNDGQPIEARFSGTLRPDQRQAAEAMLEHDFGVLCAPTAFGKTVVAANLIARRGVSTLVLVHRAELLRQWQERLQSFLAGTDAAVGRIGGGRSRANGRLDVALMQSLSRKGEVDSIVADYGHVVVDECHHLGAATFEAVLRAARPRYVLGLTATPVRRDGQQPVIFMQCGPVRYAAPRPPDAPRDLAVIPRFIDTRLRAGADAPIQEVFREIAADALRTKAIADEAALAYRRGRKVLVLTERKAHVDAIREALADCVERTFVLHGRMSRAQRNELTLELAALDGAAPRILLATGRLIGEGFDHAPLDTLILAMPVSWKGTLQQYAGRLHREHAGKAEVRIIDFVDTGQPALMRMWARRQAGYRAMDYRIIDERVGAGLDLFPIAISETGR